MDENNVIQFNKAEIEKKLLNFKANKEYEALEERLLQLPQFKGRVKDKGKLKKEVIKKGQMWWIDSLGGLYQVAEVQKDRLKLDQIDLNATFSAGITIYEVNQEMTATEEPINLFDEEILNRVEGDLSKFLWDSDGTEYFLLYSRELHFFTFFKCDPDLDDLLFQENFHYKLLLKELKESLKNWTLISIDYIQDEEKHEGEPPCIEIWVRDKFDGEKTAVNNHMFYLFPYEPISF